MTTVDAETTNTANRSENTKPVTIQLRDDLLQKLKIVAILQELTVSDLLAESAAGLVKRDLKKLLSRIEQ